MNQLTTVAAPGLVPSLNWTTRQLDTIQRTVAKDTNTDEFNLFIEYAKVKGLDPFSRQVIAIVFSKDDPKKRQMSIITTQEGCRVMAARCHDYRPAEDEPTYEYDPALKSPTNPLGIVKCTTKLWKQDARTGEWHPVNGTAYWEEFVPIKTDDIAFEWIETGEFHQDSGKAKKRKRVKEGVDLAKHQKVDDSGNWAKMPRLMIAKCATMQALRAGWPTVFSGVYGEEEMDRARVLDLTASEMVEMEREERRKKAIAMSSDEYPWVDDTGTLHFIPAGRFADHVIQIAQACTSIDELDKKRERNREGLRRFWAMHKDDAIQMNKEIEEIEKGLRNTIKKSSLVEA